MNYSNFDYKEACLKDSMFKLELMLLCSRCQKHLKYCTEVWKREDVFDLVSIIVVGSVYLFYFLCTFIFSLFDSLWYMITHKPEDKSIVRYSEIKWDSQKMEQSIKDNENYTSYENIERLTTIVEDIKEKIIAEEQSKGIVSNISSLSNNTYKGTQVQTKRKYKRKSERLMERNIALSTLRKAFSSSNILCGVVISNNFRKIPDDELIQYTTLGELSQPYLTQIVSFGDKINEALKILLKDRVNFCYKRKEKKHYVLIEDGDLNPLKNGIEELLGLKEIKISLVRN